jgi:hypothetical protein
VEDRCVVAFPGLEVLSFKYRAVQLNLLSWRDYIEIDNPAVTTLACKMDTAPQDRKTVKFECLRRLLAYGLEPRRLSFLVGFVETYLRLAPDEEKEVRDRLMELDPSKKEILKMFWTHSHEQGWQEGLVQGVRQQAIAQLERIARRRAWVLDERTMHRISSLSAGDLDELSDAVLDFTDQDQLERWLSRLIPSAN